MCAKVTPYINCISMYCVQDIKDSEDWNPDFEEEYDDENNDMVKCWKFK